MENGRKTIHLIFLRVYEIGKDLYETEDGTKIDGKGNVITTILKSV